MSQDNIAGCTACAFVLAVVGGIYVISRDYDLRYPTCMERMGDKGMSYDRAKATCR